MMRRIAGAFLAVCVLWATGAAGQDFNNMEVLGENLSWTPGSGVTLTKANGFFRGEHTSGTTDASSEFKLYSSDNARWMGNGQAFGSYPVGNTMSGNAANATFNETSGRTYSFTANVVDRTADLYLIIQETLSPPVTIVGFSSEVLNGGSFDRVKYADDASEVANNVDTVSITLGAAPSAGESVFLYYSTDDFVSQANSDIVAASGAGTSWSVDIPAQPGGTTVDYYVLTSTYTEGSLDGVGSEIDVLFRTLKDGKGSQLDYSVYNTGNSFHNLTQTAGGAGERMRAGGNLDTGNSFDGTEASARIYSGNVYQVATVSKEQSDYTLHYRFGTGSWSSQAGFHNNDAGNDKYWLSTLALTGQSAGAVVSYYLEITYNDAVTTYVYDSSGSHITGDEATAQASPFTFNYGVSSDPVGTMFNMK